MKTTVTKTCLLGILILALASCSRKVSEGMTSSTGTRAELFEVVQKVNASRSGLEQVSARLSLDLAMGTQDVKVSGDLKMKRNSIIQITLQAIGGLITVGRLEFTPENMLVMDNMNKRYVRIAYRDVDFLRDNGIDFYTFQALLWSELFTPGAGDTPPQAETFMGQADGKEMRLQLADSRLAIIFISNATGQLLQSTILGRQHQRGMLCEYLDWSNLNDKRFPNKLQITVKTGGQDIVTNLSLSRLREDTSWKGTPTEVNESKYRQLTLQQVWNAVMSLAK